eukprot:1158245-Pelagomonas_calceolata.AAC.3
MFFGPCSGALESGHGWHFTMPPRHTPIPSPITVRMGYFAKNVCAASAALFSAHVTEMHESRICSKQRGAPSLYQHRSPCTHDPAGLNNYNGISRGSRYVEELVQAQVSSGIPSERVIVGGFRSSQGYRSQALTSIEVQTKAELSGLRVEAGICTGAGTKGCSGAGITASPTCVKGKTQRSRHNCLAHMCENL